MDSNFNEETLKNRIKTFYSQLFEKGNPFYDEWSEGRMGVTRVEILTIDEEKKYLYAEIFCRKGHSLTCLWSVEDDATCLMWRGTSPMGNSSGYSFSNGYLIRHDWSSFNVSKIVGSTGNVLNLKSIELKNPILNSIEENKFSIQFDWSFKERISGTLQISSK